MLEVVHALEEVNGDVALEELGNECARPEGEGSDLVRVPAQREQEVSRDAVPDPNGPVLGTGCEPSAVGTEGEGGEVRRARSGLGARATTASASDPTTRCSNASETRAFN